MKNYRIEDRVAFYNERFNGRYSRLHMHSNGMMYGFWLIGRWHASDRKFYGSYPPSYLKRAQSLFPDAERILHLFSGTLKGDGNRVVTFDCNPDLKPDVVGDAEKLPQYFKPSSFDVIYSDPPYEQRDFEVYGTKMFSKPRVLSMCHKILKDGGFVVWLDTVLVPFSNRMWNCVGLIGVLQSTNHRVRVCSVFRKPTDEQVVRRKTIEDI